MTTSALRSVRGVLSACMFLALIGAAAPRALADCSVPTSQEVKDDGGLTGNSCIQILTLPPIPSPHVEACSVTLGNQIWTVSGSVNSWSNTGRPQMPTARCDIYTPGTNTWSAGPDVNIARICYPNVYNVNGTLFLIGGLQETQPDSGQFVPCHRVEVCRPDGTGYSGLGVTIASGDRAWHLLPTSYNMPSNDANYWNRSTAVVGDTLFLFAPGKTLSFDTATGVWRDNLATHAGANGDFSVAIALNNEVYVSGGCGGPSPGCPEASMFARYDPPSNAWTDLARFPSPGLAEHTMEIVGGTKLLVVGGDFNGTALYYYDPASNTMVKRESKPPSGDPTAYSRSDHCSGIWNGMVYILGGVVAGTANVEPASLAIGLPVE